MLSNAVIEVWSFVFLIYRSWLSHTLSSVYNKINFNFLALLDKSKITSQSAEMALS